MPAVDVGTQKQIKGFIHLHNAEERQLEQAENRWMLWSITSHRKLKPYHALALKRMLGVKKQPRVISILSQGLLWSVDESYVKGKECEMPSDSRPRISQGISMFAEGQHGDHKLETRELLF